MSCYVGNVILKLLNLPVEVLVLNLEMLLSRLSIIESSGHLVQSCVGGGLNQLALLVKLGLALDSILKIKTSLTKVIVLLILDLLGIKTVNLRNSSRRLSLETFKIGAGLLGLLQVFIMLSCFLLEASPLTLFSC